MMENITLTYDAGTGEMRLTKKSKDYLNRLFESNSQGNEILDVLTADALCDCKYIFDQAYRSFVGREKNLGN